MPMIELWYGGTIQECQPMKFQERISYFIVVPVNLTNPVHWLHLMLKFELSTDRIQQTVGNESGRHIDDRGYTTYAEIFRSWRISAITCQA
ncbi:hypothetical protein JQ629_26110 [Bradyrhizobium sp. AUGA SZCCT0222]|uniref:hypothetical protein n=1 Tax=Bradyrhizobium sp. AUGA SZCCT0222 TaxID=2807668 RepID=UPI001BA7CD14|nr:hypothetical protein [Bradyrhizobium sp. AUGA SZCCT0222]MBR1270955.1 hypothetical protein [Bradyrhizobium sp. AUGA SZCCT0222]